VPVAGLTALVGDHGVYAVFALLIAAAVVPAASELVMLYGGAIVSGAIPGAHVVLFGHPISSHAGAYIAIALAGLAGNLVGAAVGWAVGVRGGRPLLERHGGKIHVGAEKLARAERWFERNASLAVLLGFATPFVRSFVAMPAGIARVPLGRFLALAAIGCGVFCFALAGVGWGVGASYDEARRYLDVVVAAAILLVLAGVIVRRRRSSRLAGGRADHPAR
jgi:membrane protein DedA with SNARE-associated domain